MYIHIHVLKCINKPWAMAVKSSARTWLSVRYSRSPVNTGQVQKKNVREKKKRKKKMGVQHTHRYMHAFSMHPNTCIHTHTHTHTHIRAPTHWTNQLVLKTQAHTLGDAHAHTHPHTRMNNVTRMNTPLANIVCTRINESCHTHEWTMSHTRTRMNESCHTHAHLWNLP